MHYKPGWLVKSVVYYEEQEGDNHCRDNNQLPLPEISTIQRLLSSADVGFGFNDLALENLGKVLTNLKRHLRYGTLMWDEMSIWKDLTWDSKMLRRYGLINFGSDIKEAAEQGLTDHVLVLVFRPFRHKWIHPIGWFASKGAANQHVLSEIIMIAIIFAAPRRCHRQGYCLWRPPAFFPLNKTALSKIGVSCKKSGRNFFEHLLDENIKTYPT